MKFLVDAQLPQALARWLCEQGHDTQHVEDIGLRDAEDQVIWAQAMNTDAIILTKDEDFAARAARDATSPVIVWLRVGNATNRALFQWLEPRWSQIVVLLNAGHRLMKSVDVLVIIREIYGKRITKMRPHAPPAPSRL